MYGCCASSPKPRDSFPCSCRTDYQTGWQDQNDCEQNSFKRILPQVSKALCEERVIVLLDGLYQNGPCIQAITELREGTDRWAYIIVCKENNYVQLQVRCLKKVGSLKKKTWQVKRKGKTIHCTFSYAPNLILNDSHQYITTHYFSYKETDDTGNILYSCDWITDLPIETMISSLSNSHIKYVLNRELLIY